MVTFYDKTEIQTSKFLRTLMLYKSSNGGYEFENRIVFSLDIHLDAKGGFLGGIVNFWKF